MSNFNLIPALYMQRKSKQMLLRKTARNAAVVLAVVVLGFLSFRFYVSGVEEELGALQEARSISDSERAAYTTLVAQRQVLEDRVHLLEGLRSGLTAAELVLSVERSVPLDSIWFSDFRVRRAGVVTDGEATPISPAALLASRESASADDWQIVSYLDIRGQAIDHAALSEFSRTLLGLAYVHEVNLQRSTLAVAAPGERPLVNFELSIVIRSGRSRASEEGAEVIGAEVAA